MRKRNFQQMHSVYIILVTYKGKRWYDKCFGSLRQSTIPIQTVVVDNSPTEEDSEYIKAHFPKVHVIHTGENLGFGRANNIGMRYAMDNGCDYVFLLNQDTWLEQPDAIERLVEIADKHPEYGVVSPMHVDAEKTSLNMGLGLHETNMSLLSDLYLNQVGDIYETNYANAAAWLLPRKTLETIGGFDPIFKHYEEDDNYLNRVQYHGLKIGVCPSVQIVHDHVDSPLTDERLAIRQQQFLLVQWTDINKPFSLWRIMRYNIRKMIVFICHGDKRRAMGMWRQLQYCKTMCDAIEHSRAENVQAKASWL